MNLEDGITSGDYKTIQGNLFVTGNISDVYSKADIDTRVRALETKVEAYKKGELIETISSSCDGSVIEVISGTYTITDVTAEQLGTTTYTTVTGSEISYTPPAGTKRVHYRFWYHFDVTENSGISHHILQIDGTEVYPSANTFASNYASTNWHHACFPVSVEYTINCAADSDDANNARFTSWTSPKTLRVQYREYNGSYESSLHRNEWWNGTSASGNYIIVKPHLTIQAYA